MSKKKININISSDFRKYISNQSIFMLLIVFFFYAVFYNQFGVSVATYMLWVMLIFTVLFLYLDLKYMYKIQTLRDDLDDLLFIIKNLKK